MNTPRLAVRCKVRFAFVLSVAVIALFTARAGASQSYLLTFSGTVDGSDLVTLNGNTGNWQHKSFQFPSNVIIDGQAWNPKVQPNLTFASPLIPPSLSGYAIRIRRFQGRDTATAQIQGNKLQLGLSDTPNGADTYKFNVALIPEVKGPTATAATLKITANVDGSDELMIGKNGAAWVHRFWSQPSNVSLNGVKWDPASHHTLANTGPTQYLPAGVNFQNATIAQTKGRDIVGIDHFSDHVDVFFADAPVGADLYSVTLTFPSTGLAAPLAGDANSDGKVDLTDLATINRNMGKHNETWSQGDFNLDGVVDATDRALWASNYKGPASGSQIALTDAAVPEPASGIGLLIFAVAAGLRRRSK